MRRRGIVMDMLAAMQSFVRVAEAGSFSSVAKERNTTQPAISRQVATLEEVLGVRLLQRTTRGLVLTDDGREFLDHAHHVLEAVEAAKESVGNRRGGPTGHVRIAMPAMMSAYFAGALRKLLAENPHLSVEIVTRDEPPDLIAQGIDLAVGRGEPRGGATLVTRRMGMTRQILVAAPSYLAGRTLPTHPENLAAHECLLYTAQHEPTEWQFEGEGCVVTVPVSGRFSADNMAALHHAALSGLGIVAVARLVVQDDLAAGRLLELMPGWVPQPLPLYVAYPSRRLLSPRTRVVIDFLAEFLAHVSGTNQLKVE
jgi:DNA-binding transcriptional LysR family regulator